MWADISASKQLRRSWSARLRRLGLRAMAQLHAMGDGASWIWKATAGALSGCRQTLDIFHASEHIATAGRHLFGEETAVMTTFHHQGRQRLLEQGWAGVCRLMAEELAVKDTPARRRALDRMIGYLPTIPSGSTTAVVWRVVMQLAAV